MSGQNGRVLRGDCRELMRSLPAESVDAIVTDPPYELGFMGKSWDSAGVSFDPATWAEALRVLKPGGHLLAFGGSRTYHRIAVAIEDAGFEIRDSLMWIYGSGFPKSHNLKGDWDGWGTALKPSHEPIVLARKPLIGTVAENVLAHGTGALNIDASRLEGSRWPANTLWDEETAAQLDEQSGVRPGGNYPTQRGSGKVTGFGPGQPTPGGARKMADSGGASRFFYVAKPGKRERNAGATNIHPTVKPIALMRYLIKLITPPGGVVLDPFLGSGSTACAAVLEGFDYIGIELTPEYADIAEARIANWKKEAK